MKLSTENGDASVSKTYIHGTDFSDTLLRLLWSTLFKKRLDKWFADVEI